MKRKENKRRREKERCLQARILIDDVHRRVTQDFNQLSPFPLQLIKSDQRIGDGDGKIKIFTLSKSLETRGNEKGCMMMRRRSGGM